MTIATGGFDLRAITVKPVIFFTLHGGGLCNQASAEIISALENHIDDNKIECTVFDDPGKCTARIKSIPTHQIVVLFDKQLRGRCFRPIFRGDSARSFPAWSGDALWGVEVNPALPEIMISPAPAIKSRVHTAAYQIAADFHGNYLNNLAKGWFPFGQPRKLDVSPERRIRRQQKRILAAHQKAKDKASFMADPLFL